VIKMQDFQDHKADGTCSGHCVLKVKKRKPTNWLYGDFSGKLLLVSHS
jgi:hypothetical protein